MNDDKKTVIRANDGSLKVIDDTGDVYSPETGHEVVVILEGVLYVVIDGEGEVIETLTRAD